MSQSTLVEEVRQVECGYEQNQRRYAESLQLAKRLPLADRQQLVRELEISCWEDDPTYQAYVEEQNERSMEREEEAIPF